MELNLSKINNIRYNKESKRNERIISTINEKFKNNI